MLRPREHKRQRAEAHPCHGVVAEPQPARSRQRAVMIHYHGEAAVDLATIALARVQQEHGDEAVEAAAALNNLGKAFGELGDYRKLQELLARALAIFEREYGAAHPNVAATLSTISDPRRK